MRNKSTKRTLGSLVLVFESVIVFFATLVAFGLEVYEDPATIWIVGLTFSFVLVITPAVLGRPGSYVFGWILQVLLLALGFWVPLMYLLGVIFVGIWAWGMVAGGTIDRARANLDAQRIQMDQNGSTSENNPKG
jgi:hypothetical protein